MTRDHNGLDRADLDRWLTTQPEEPCCVDCGAEDCLPDEEVCAPCHKVRAEARAEADIAREERKVEGP